MGLGGVKADLCFSVKSTLNILRSLHISLGVAEYSTCHGFGVVAGRASLQPKQP